MILILLKAFQNLRYIDLIFLKRVQSTILCFKQTKIHTNSYKLWMQFFSLPDRLAKVWHNSECSKLRHVSQVWGLQRVGSKMMVETLGLGSVDISTLCWGRGMLRPSGVWRNDASHLNHSGKYVAWIWGYTLKQYFAVASVASFMGFGTKRSCHLPIAECYKSCFLMTWKPFIAAIIIDVLCLFI